MESGDRRGAARLPRGVRAAPFPRHPEHADDRSREHFRGLHAAPERARRGARPPGRGPPALHLVGPAGLGKIDDRPASRRGRQSPVRRRSRAPSRPRGSARHPLARRRRPHPLGAAGLPAAVRRFRTLAHQPRGAAVGGADGPGGALPARAGPQGRRIRAPRGRVAHRLRQPGDRPRRRPPHAHAACLPLRPSRDPGRRRGLARLGCGQRDRSRGTFLHHVRARPPAPVRPPVEGACLRVSPDMGIREQHRQAPQRARPGGRAGAVPGHRRRGRGGRIRGVPQGLARAAAWRAP